MHPLRLFLAALAGLALSVALHSQTSRTSAVQNESPIKVSVNEVILDVVVTDKRGHQAKDLRLEDFEVYEDGVRQKLSSIREVGVVSEVAAAQKPGAPVAIETPPAQVPRRTTVPQISLITLVFDRISLSGRKLARDAAFQYFKELGPTDFVSVVAIDRVLRVLAPFTQDLERLKRAVELAAGGTPQQFAEVSDSLREALNQLEISTAAAEAAVATVGRGGGTGAGAGSAFAEAAMSQATANMLRQTGVGDESIQGRATIEALMNVIRGARVLPGRKAVVFFGQRIALPVQVIERFRDLISAANRANISFYCIDTAGLETGTQLSQMSRELGRIAAVSKAQQSRRAGAVTQDEVMLAEDASNVTRMPTQNNLVDLAESTGGVLIANTNDLGSGLHRVSEDLRSHYELSYIPANEVYDGSFRKVEVKVKRSGLVARSREGYYAFRSNDVAESPYEMPLLAALNSQTSQHDLAVRSSSMLFPTSGSRSEAVFYLEFPLSDFSFPADGRKKEYSAKVQLMVLVKNAAGNILEKFSQEFPFQGPLERAAETRARNFLFYRTADLAPGRYTVEMVVRDPLAGKVTTKKSVLIVPVRTIRSLGLSSIVLVKRLEDARTDANLLENPFLLGKQTVVPYLDSTIALKDAIQLAFYFVAAAPAAGEATMDTILSKDGKPLGHTGERVLPPPDARGMIRYVAALPLTDLTEGSYDVQVVVRQGDTIVNGRVAFSIQ